VSCAEDLFGSLPAPPPPPPRVLPLHRAGAAGLPPMYFAKSRVPAPLFAHAVRRGPPRASRFCEPGAA